MTDSSPPPDRGPEAVLERLARLDSQECRRLVADVWDHAGWKTNVTTGGSVDVLAMRRDDDVRRQAIRVLQRPPDATLEPSDLADVRTHDRETVTDVVVTTARLSEAARRYADDRDISLIGAGDLRGFVAGEALADVISPGIREALFDRHLDTAVDATVRWHSPEDRDDGGETARSPGADDGGDATAAEDGNAREPTPAPSPLAPVAAVFALPSRVLARIVGRPLPGTRTATRPVRWTARLLWTLVVVALVFTVLVGLLTTVLLVGELLLDTTLLPPVRLAPPPGPFP